MESASMDTFLFFGVWWFKVLGALWLREIFPLVAEGHLFEALLHGLFISL